MERRWPRSPHPPTVADHRYYWRTSPLLSHQLHDALWPWLVPILVPRPRINRSRETFPILFVRVNGSSELPSSSRIGWSGSKGEWAICARAELGASSYPFVLPLARKFHRMETAIGGSGDGEPRPCPCSPPVASPLQSRRPLHALYLWSSPVSLHCAQHTALFICVGGATSCLGQILTLLRTIRHQYRFVWLCLLLGLLLSVSLESLAIYIGGVACTHSFAMILTNKNLSVVWGRWADSLILQMT